MASSSPGDCTGAVRSTEGEVRASGSGGRSGRDAGVGAASGAGAVTGRGARSAERAAAVVPLPDGRAAEGAAAP